MYLVNYDMHHLERQPFFEDTTCRTECITIAPNLTENASTSSSHTTMQCESRSPVHVTLLVRTVNGDPPTEACP